MIDRRTVLSALAATPFAALLGSPGASAVTATSWKQAFDDALANNPRLLGWKGLTNKHLSSTNPRVKGTLPAGLVGTFYRNGPARHERGGQRYRH